MTTLSWNDIIFSFLCLQKEKLDWKTSDDSLFEKRAVLADMAEHFWLEHDSGKPYFCVALFEINDTTGLMIYMTSGNIILSIGQITAKEIERSLDSGEKTGASLRPYQKSALIQSHLQFMRAGTISAHKRAELMGRFQ